jgi:hypothetical protein
MIRVGSELTTDQAIALVDGLGARSGFGDDWLRIWGLKFVMDSGVEGAAMEQPYANDPGNSRLTRQQAVAAVKDRRGASMSGQLGDDRSERISGVRADDDI